ncbi:hypothetical protein ACTWQF_34125 [Streptomyces sp. 8N114]|uniref:hypothetical protein n=1 Tax=Streptomyces sp. 8N114 TaxID=3457419 RepID=UPI003FD25DFC
MRTDAPARGRDRTGELQLRHGRRLSAYIAARLGPDHYRQADAVSRQVWQVVRASPALIEVSADREFTALAHVARQVLVRRYLAARSTPTWPPAPARLLSTTPLGVAA